MVKQRKERKQRHQNHIAIPPCEWSNTALCGTVWPTVCDLRCVASLTSLCMAMFLSGFALLIIVSHHINPSNNAIVIILQLLCVLSFCYILKHFKTCRFRQSIDKSPSSNDLTANMPKRSETKTRHLNQEYSSSSMPLTLHQQCTNLVSTANP